MHVLCHLIADFFISAEANASITTQSEVKICPRKFAYRGRSTKASIALTIESLLKLSHLTLHDAASCLVIDSMCYLECPILVDPQKIRIYSAL
jgi:hypothetical protein